MDEQSIKEHLRALAQRSGLTLTNLREHRDLWEKLDLAGPDELRGHIVENLRRLDGTREGASLRQAYGLEDADDPPSSLGSRRSALAKQWGVSIDTIKRYERSAVDQLYLWMFPPELASSRSTRSFSEELLGPVDVDMTNADSTTTLFRANGLQLAVTRSNTHGDGVPHIDLWFDEDYTGSGRSVAAFYLPGTDEDPHSLLQFQLGQVAVLVKFDLKQDTSAIRIGFSGPARPSQVMHGPIPHPSRLFSGSDVDRSKWKIGATNGSWLGLLYDERPTVSTVISLTNFLEEWEEEQGEDMIRTGLLIPIVEMSDGA